MFVGIVHKVLKTRAMRQNLFRYNLQSSMCHFSRNKIRRWCFHQVLTYHFRSLCPGIPNVSVSVHRTFL